MIEVDPSEYEDLVTLDTEAGILEIAPLEETPDDDVFFGVIFSLEDADEEEEFFTVIVPPGINPGFLNDIFDEDDEDDEDYEDDEDFEDDEDYEDDEDEDYDEDDEDFDDEDYDEDDEDFDGEDDVEDDDEDFDEDEIEEPDQILEDIEELADYDVDIANLEYDISNIFDSQLGELPDKRKQEIFGDLIRARASSLEQ